MIRRKGNGSGSGNNGGEGKGEVLPAGHAPETLTLTKTGRPVVGPTKNIARADNPFFCNPPKEHYFKPGNPGGPGRPKIHLTMELIKQLEQKDPRTGQPKFVAFVESILRKAMGDSPGNGIAAQMIWDRTEGPLKQKLELSGAVAHIHTSMSELIQLTKLTDVQLLAIEQLGLTQLVIAEQEAREREVDGV